MDDSQRLQLDRMIGELESRRQTDRETHRREAVEANRQRYLFQDLEQEILTPALRQLMSRLESKGHMTQLRKTRPGHLRLDVQLQTERPTWGRFEVLLHAGKEIIEVAYQQGWNSPHRRRFPLHRFDETVFGDQLLAFMTALSAAS